MSEWSTCKNILCIRPDNMGDVLMTGPAMRALKETFNCRITLLTSRMGSLITPYMKEIDDTIVYTLPWVKSDNTISYEACDQLVWELKRRRFDAAIIFTVYSQNPLPSVLLAFMAGIPRRLAYCRENPYQLLTGWVPDKEPYSFFTHQVQRDLGLVAHTGAYTADQRLRVCFHKKALHTALDKMRSRGMDIYKKWMILHPCVSEKKREYPAALWIQLARLIHAHTGHQIVLTGGPGDEPLTEYIQKEAGGYALSMAGALSIEEFIAVIDGASLLVSVNTAAIHIAAATHTPVIVLYALTNPQHTPWKVRNKVFPFSVEDGIQSRNEVVRYVHHTLFNTVVPLPAPADILAAVMELLAIKEKEKLTY